MPRKILKNDWVSVFGEKPAFNDKIDNGRSLKFLRRSGMTVEKAMECLKRAGLDGKAFMVTSTWWSGVRVHVYV